ncbi:5'-nucleotidase C-terminal domain-containing protein [Staphylococcus aureus]|uniref:5'-nucleotidase C-terminal domain-containing protein n=1 Tax=Staphylococcus aureus TaxID=1280 RepID=UPI0004F2806D|nr:5'-nucleotidase C-terminal domain-containing protein [Staphylococcus aureus]
MKALLLKTSVWLVLLFSAMGLWQVSSAAEQHTPMKAHAVTTIDKATTDKQQVPPTKEAAHHYGEEAATNVSASAQGTADDTNNKVTSNAPSNKPSTAVSTTVNETRDVDTQQASTQKPTRTATFKLSNAKTASLSPRMFATNVPQTTTHKILHTNDIHSRLAEEKGRVIGMAKLKTVKEQEKPDLMLDAGDAFQGLPLSNQSKGEEMAKAMNAVGYDAMAVGNHEFDFGYDQLKKLEGMLDFPMLSTNVYKDGKRAFKPSTIVTKNGIRYGIIGVTTPETKTKARPEGIKGVEFRDPLQSVTAEMMRIYKDVDTFVVISHLGIDPSTQETWRGDYLVKQLSQNPQLKKRITVIDGHSHTVLQNGQIYNNDALAQTGTALANIGKITFNYRNGEVSNIKPSLINVKDVENVTPNKALAEQINQADQTFRAQTAEVIIPNNTIAQIDVKGSDVWTAFEHSLGAPTTQKDGKTVLTANGGLLHISDSIRVYYDMNKPSGKRINAIQILNKETGKFENIDLKRVYHVTMNDFTASGGDGYSMFGGPREEGISLDQVLASYLKTANLAKYDTTEPQRMLLGKPAVSEQPAKGQQSSKGSESGKDAQPIGKDKVMDPAKQPAPSKVVLLPAHRGTVSSGREGSDRALEGTAVSSKSGKQLASMSAPKGSTHEKQLPKTGTDQSSSPAAMFVLVAGIGLIATVRRRKAS